MHSINWGVLIVLLLVSTHFSGPPLAILIRWLPDEAEASAFSIFKIPGDSSVQPKGSVPCLDKSSDPSKIFLLLVE